jgi:hypothetical protein
MRRTINFLSQKKSTYSKMIRTAIFLFAGFVGAGIFFLPKNFETNNATTTTTNAFNTEAPAVDQARMLLRKVGLTGKCSSELPILDTLFASRIGQPCSITRDQVRAYLNKIHVNDWEVGGNLDMPVSSTSSGIFAKYMVIHDTSFPRYGSEFPNNINDDSWEWNRLNRWVANVTHVFVNRAGDSKTATPFHEGMTATKLERFVMGQGASKGLYLHVELIQPRKARNGFGRGNDVDSPTPGFTNAQYVRLAQLYTIASVRKGEWLIPAFHACVDQGIKYAHDDPQGFELDKFFTTLKTVWAEIETPVTPMPAVTNSTIGSGQ